MTRACHKCRRPSGPGAHELRPYGPCGALVCAGCMFGEDGSAPDPAVRAEAERQFRAMLAAAEAKAGDDGEVVAIGTEAGPIVMPAPGRPGKN